MPAKPISNMTGSTYLDEIEVHKTIQQYLPDDTLTVAVLAEWMGKDHFWGTTKRKQSKRIRKYGRYYNLVELSSIVISLERKSASSKSIELW